MVVIGHVTTLAKIAVLEHAVAVMADVRLTAKIPVLVAVLEVVMVVAKEPV